MTTPTTTREYLKTQGITVGKRGRFSAAAKNAIAEASKKGVVFSDKKNVKQYNKDVVPCNFWWETGRVAGDSPFWYNDKERRTQWQKQMK